MGFSRGLSEVGVARRLGEAFVAGALAEIAKGCMGQKVSSSGPQLLFMFLFTNEISPFFEPYPMIAV